VGGALAPVAAVTSSHQELPVGCLWFTHDLSGAWQGRNADHVWEKRCSGLDLLGCDPGSGTAARGFNTRKSEMTYRSLRLRDGVRATPSRSPVVCRIVGAPPLGSPAQVIPGRTLREGEGRAGSRASPQLQSTPLFSRRRAAGGPVPVPLAGRLQGRLRQWWTELDLQGRPHLPDRFSSPRMEPKQRRYLGCERS
jgi:hypothetical protein